MAAAPASPHNNSNSAEPSQGNPNSAEPSQESCSFCSKPLEGRYAPHLCEACGRAQPVSKSEDYFAALGASRRFAQDTGALERRFYELSRALHPDRFSAQGADALRASLERMSFLNQAYNTLKDPAARRQYLLEREGVKFEGKSQIPVELAESWFELQDLLAEDPAAAAGKIREFEAELGALKARGADEIHALESGYDTAPSREVLEKIARKIHSQSYLGSLERDISRLKAKAS